METTSDAIKKQEEQIFSCLESRVAENDIEDSNLLCNPTPLFARLKARQQLCVSEDSPFSRLRQKADEYTDEELNRLREEKANLLRKETEEIKQQLELVKSRLSELNKHRKSDEVEQEGLDKQESEHLCDKHQASGLKNESVGSNSKKEVAIQTQQQEETGQRLRPLTGKTDCPNCSCDRRQSVCDDCLKFPFALRPFASTSQSTSTDTRRPSFIKRQLQMQQQSKHASEQQQGRSNSSSAQEWAQPIVNYDDRPIRPAPEYREKEHSHLKAKVEKVQADHSIVPNKIYTIGKSLDDKRSKLAQAIEELQSMMDKVKRRGDRLEQERKVAHLYKQQWRYGPAIGGNARQPNYLSRLDPNLMRDTNSLMGFQHVEPSMKLRQYPPTDKAAPQAKPRPKPRFTKMAAQTVSSKAKMVDKYGPTQALSAQSRSKSFESLRSVAKENKRQAEVMKPETTLASRVVNHNLPNGKSASDTNLSASSPDAIEEEIEEKIEEKEKIEEYQAQYAINNSSPSADHVRGQIGQSNKSKEDNIPEMVQETEEKVQKMTWIPVFGETEIRTVTKRTPKRKVQILPDNTNQTATIKQTGSILRTSKTNQRFTSSARNKNGDRVLNEATKKLHFASSLLENERRDSCTRNQLTIKRTLPPRAEPRSKSTSSSPAAAEPSASGRSSQMDTKFNRTNSDPVTVSQQLQPPNPLRSTDGVEMAAQNLISGATKEISRLEQMINEQQRVLTQLAANQDGEKDGHDKNGRSQQKCECPCCTSSTAVKSRIPSGQCQASSSNRANLIHNLRERLNKTKARLAKTLEEERARHKQLEQRVDSSLRKQSDLENENQLLKRSLSNCIDTCLRDISSTFESLSDTLNDSMIATHLDTGQPDEMGRPLGVRESTAIQASTPTTISTTSSNNTSALANAAQLISDNRHLKRMKSHIETIERQRRGIFEELSNEKQRSQKLELELKRSKEELEQLIAAKQRLESQLASSGECDGAESLLEKNSMTSQQVTEPKPSTSSAEPLLSSTNVARIADTSRVFTEDSSQAKSFSEENSSTFNSIDIYRQYIQSMSPDLDAIRKERQMILSEFDNIKKMLIDMDR